MRPAGGVLRTADDFRRFSICSNHHRGSYPSPALAYASYPFVDLPPGIILRCKLFPSDKFAEIRLYFFYEIAYNGAGDKSEFGGENMTAHMRLRIILRCKLFPSDKFAEIRLYFFYEIAYNGAGDKSEFGGENMTAHMRLR